MVGILQLVGEPARSGRQGLHHVGIAGPPQSQEVVVLADHLVSRAGKVQREGGHIAAEVVDLEDQVLGQVLGAAPHHETHAGIGQPVLVPADVDRDHPGQAEIPLEVGVQERHHEAATGGVHVDRDVEALLLLELVQCGADLSDRLQLTGVGGAQDAHHPDGVLVDRVDHLLRGDDVAVVGHRQIFRFDLEVAAEFLPHHLDIGAHHQIRGAGLPGVGVVGIGLVVIGLGHALLPAPFQRQAGQHHRLRRSDGRRADGTGGVVVAQVLGMEKIRNHCHTTGFDRSGSRVLVLVDHVLVERLGHQLLGLGVHPRRDERRQVEPGTAVEHQFVVDEPVGGGRFHGFVRKPQRRDRIGRQPAGIGGGDRR